MKKLTKRPKPAKREFRPVDRLIPRARLQASARVWRVRPDHHRPFVVEVRIARDPRRMRDEMRRIDNATLDDLDPRGLGLVRHWSSVIGQRHVIRPRGVIARMYLNAQSISGGQGAEIIAHECTHAGMAWARLQRANLKVMPGEEVLCYAVGRMVPQVVHACRAMGIW